MTYYLELCNSLSTGEIYSKALSWKFRGFDTPYPYSFIFYTQNARYDIPMNEEM